MDELINSLQLAVGNAGALDNPSTGSLWSQACYWPYYQQPLVYHTCGHNIGSDEELILNAMRRDPKIKAALLKKALAELLKSLEE